MRFNYSFLVTFLFLFISVIIFAQEAPQIDLQPVDQTVCEGDSAGFLIEATGPGELLYQWQKDEVDLPDETDSICIISTVKINDAGSYRCIVSNDDGSDTTEIAQLIVDFVLPTQLLGPHEVENYDTSLFSVVTTETHTYEFMVSQGTVLETTDTTVLVEWGADEIGFVKVLESSANGCYGDTVSRLVIIGNVAPFFITQPVDQTVCNGDSVSFEIEAAGTSDLHYQWQLNEKDIVRETTNILTIPSVDIDDEGEYRCIVSNTVSADTSDIAILDIDFVEPAEINGANVVDANDTIVYSIIPSEGHSYVFSLSAGMLLESSDTSMTVLWDTPGISYVHLVETNSLGCEGDTVDYQVLVFGDGTAVLFLDQPISQGVCLNDSVSFMVEAAGYPELVFQWQKDGANIENANDSIFTILNAQYDDEAEYRCIVTNDFGSETSDIAVLSVDEIEPTDILGPQYVQEFEVVVYSVSYTEGHIYEFQVAGGNITQSTENSITVHWGATGFGFVNMLESVENGCVGEWVELEIYVGTVDIEQEKETVQKIYPNPVSDFVNIQSIGQNTLKIYDILGSQVLETQFENEISINLSHLEQGMYIYRINNRTGRIIKK